MTSLTTLTATSALQSFDMPKAGSPDADRPAAGPVAGAATRRVAAAVLGVVVGLATLVALVPDLRGTRGGPAIATPAAKADAERLALLRPPRCTRCG